MLPIIWLIISATFVHQLTQVNSYPESELIKNLPGQPTVNFNQFGGYVTVDETQQRHLFYYFVEAQSNPHSKPLVLWLNGGPGCSSVGYGAFIENGPFKPNENSLIKNEYSWNKEANMLYLDSPAGVGFSYASNTSFYDFINDEITARDNLAFLQNWVAKFPEYKNRDLFVTGESYAGHYVPQLANLILKSNLKSNLKGIAIGNPLLEFNKDMNSRGVYLWSHGLISDETYGLLQNVCNYSQIRRQTPKGSLSPQCSMVNSQMLTEIGHFIDIKDVTLDVCVHQQACLLSLMEENIDVCEDDKTTKYLNRKEVQEALNAQLVGITRWTPCTIYSKLKYHLDDLEIPTLPLLGTLMKLGIQVLVYSGDQDSVLPLMGTRALVNGLAMELGLNTTQPYKPWLQDKQVGGWTQVYGDILTFATIRGAAHEAPFTQPARSLVLFSSFLQGKPHPTFESIGLTK